MDEATYKAWWPLHLRNALGEPLTPKEREQYRAGKAQLDSEEHLNFDEAAATKTRKQIADLMAQHDELLFQNKRIQDEIDKVEAALKKRKHETVEVSG